MLVGRLNISITTSVCYIKIHTIIDCAVWKISQQVVYSQTDRADALAGVKTCLRPLSKITEDLEGVSGAALVGVDPVLSYRGGQRQTSEN